MVQITNIKYLHPPPILFKL